jgi:hypothetical protein
MRQTQRREPIPSEWKRLEFFIPGFETQAARDRFDALRVAPAPEVP